MAIRVVTLCSGYDSQGLSLERLKRDYSGFDYELVAWAEFDPDSKQPIEKQSAVIAHNALFSEWSDRNLGDITNADWGIIKGDIDLLCYSTPCQSISSAGLQHGFREGSGTRSSIIWSVLDAIRVLRPKYLLLENVPAMVSKKFISDFNAWQSAVSSLGYDNYTEILNAKDYGVAQNRPRLFMVSVRRDLGLTYHFPKAFTLEKRLRDYLESVVDEKYYLSDKFIKGCIEHCDREQSEGCGFKFEPTFGDGIAKAISTLAGCRQTDNFIIEGQKDYIIYDDYNQRIPKDQDCIGTLTTNIGSSTPRNGIKLIEVKSDPRIIKLGNYSPSGHNASSIVDIEGLAPAVMENHGTVTAIVEPRVMQVGNIWPDTEKFKNRTMGRVYDPDGISPTINCCGGGDREPKIIQRAHGFNKGGIFDIAPTLTGSAWQDNNLLKLVQDGVIRIRKLTPRECFRLQGLEDCDIDKIQSTGISNSQQYKLAGNSIAIPCLYHLFRKLFVDTGNEKEQLELF